MSKRIRIGLIGAGANTRQRHIPGLLALANVEIAAVCNRRPESTIAVAREFNVARVPAMGTDRCRSRIHAVVIGTWPYLHGPITSTALQAGKHVLTEAHLSMNATEAHQMLKMARQHAHLTTQVVPSPFGLKGHTVMKELIAAGYLGGLQKCKCAASTRRWPIPMRRFPGGRMRISPATTCLDLGIVHETLIALGAGSGRSVRPGPCPLRNAASIRRAACGARRHSRQRACWPSSKTAPVPPITSAASFPSGKPLASICSAATASCTTIS